MLPIAYIARRSRQVGQRCFDEKPRGERRPRSGPAVRSYGLQQAKIVGPVDIESRFLGPQFVSLRGCSAHVFGKAVRFEGRSELVLTADKHHVCAGAFLASNQSHRLWAGFAGQLEILIGQPRQSQRREQREVRGNQCARFGAVLGGRAAAE